MMDDLRQGFRRSPLSSPRCELRSPFLPSECLPLNVRSSLLAGSRRKASAPGLRRSLTILGHLTWQELGTRRLMQSDHGWGGPGGPTLSYHPEQVISGDAIGNTARLLPRGNWGSETVTGNVPVLKSMMLGSGPPLACGRLKQDHLPSVFLHR